MTIELTSNDDILERLNFRPYRNVVERHAVQFLPCTDQPQSVTISTPWGETLYCESGDYIVNEMDAPSDRWPVNRDIFEQSYVEIRPGSFVKRPLTFLVPLVDVTGDPDATVLVQTLEGPVTVRAGDFYLARGIQNEIWPYPKNKADATLSVVELAEMAEV